MRHAGEAGSFGAECCLGADQHEARHLDQRRRGFPQIGFKPLHVGHGIAVEIEFAGQHQVAQGMFRKPALLHRPRQFLRHRMTGHVSPAKDRVQRVEPPLLPDQTQLGFADACRDAADLQVEGIERKQGRTGIIRREEARQEAVAVTRPHQFLHMFGIAHAGMASRPAATLRFSSSSRL